MASHSLRITPTPPSGPRGQAVTLAGLPTYLRSLSLPLTTVHISVLEEYQTLCLSRCPCCPSVHITFLLPPSRLSTFSLHSDHHHCSEISEGSLPPQAAGIPPILPTTAPWAWHLEGAQWEGDVPVTVQRRDKAQTKTCPSLARCLGLAFASGLRTPSAASPHSPRLHHRTATPPPAFASAGLPA